MKNLFSIIALVIFTTVSAFSDGFPSPVPATQAEVNAGTLHTKFVAPDTLASKLGVSEVSSLSLIPWGYNGLSGIYPNPSNPILSPASSIFHYASVRDQFGFTARGLDWMIYTGIQTTNSPYYASLGIMSSPDKIHWTDWGQIVATNPVAGFFNSGSVGSPGVFYSTNTDELWIFPFCSTNASGWVGGPMQIGLIKVSAGVSWTNGASAYQWQNSTNPILTFTANDGSDGGYAPCPLVINGVWTLYYSIKSNNVYYTCAATNSYTYPTNNSWVRCGIMFGDSGTYSEEPSVIQFPNGQLISFSAGDVNSYSAFPMFTTTVTNGLSGWTQLPPLQFISPNTLWTSNSTYYGSPSIWLSGDNTYQMAFSLQSGTGLDNGRSIGLVRLNFSQQSIINDAASIQTHYLSVGSPQTSANSRYVGISKSNYVFVQNGIVEGPSDPGFRNYTNYFGTIDLMGAGGLGLIGLGDGTSFPPFMYIARDNGPNTLVAGNHVAIGSSGDVSIRHGSSDYSSQTNVETWDATGVHWFGQITGDGSGITNATTSYFTNLVNGNTNVNLLTRTVQWTIPVVVSAPAGTLGSAEIDAQIQRSDGVWITVDDVDIAGGATSIIATNKASLRPVVPSGASMRVTNSTSGTGYIAGLDATKTNTFTVLP